MPFPGPLIMALEHYTKNPPDIKNVWFGPWNAILNTLFPAKEGYLVTPGLKHRPTYIPDFVVEVLKVSAAAETFRSVLVAEIRNSENQWEAKIPALENQLNLQTDTALADGTAYAKIFWIGAIGPHWRYGEKEEHARPLIDWHHTIHDEASYNDLQTLKRLVADL